ncbi:uncharacterized protein KLLA0_C16027g [Kluyveromyces lactis]|uniref:KLLA0C16027p n=1 Tax=Kluyveromyces lactis (strain ATCC 8585 / CBS 2359 / DSM 70799 / NBRC 1267 / NRRL Y-1140 / WM37) TaxID=284590 RepID=Q6CT23_KLULA|nr:uncharacterized protein KLLA0_C16027g [Kluyveromyces lactis]CAH01767.1 KLLA0C16027p [Kluyveromyces lactis]|eukprot:XP_452916.1 uncharacterized protein KLLA0_C16027g [Kluyveromyces lactis]
MSNTTPWQYTSTGSPQTPSAVSANLFGNSMSLSSTSSTSSSSVGNNNKSSMSSGQNIGMLGPAPGMLNMNMNIPMGVDSTSRLGSGAGTGVGSLMYSLPQESLLSKNMSKSFEDDLFFCPRSLLSKEELSQCSQIDLLYNQHQQQIHQNHHQQLPLPVPLQQQQNHQQQQQRPRFNPYTSQSFNPGAV